ncbi:myelin protein zero-like protein 2 [Engraulis encrasicolus]|uniref:myelin protein zero-like protein 2 n=1 Tax=Engraulis encrasicolus TaxID=184585 RepID=UPI002FCF0DEA
MCVNRLPLLVLLGLAASGLHLARGMRVYTSGEQEAVNGTDVRLKCTFESKENINPKLLTVSWNFRPLGPGHDESVFYYQEKPYPPAEGRFRKKALWAGDIMAGDASIIIREAKFTFNGTFSCQVKNPPDVHGHPGTVKLTVVYSASFSEIVVVAGIILGAIAIIMVIMILVLSIRRCRKKRQHHQHHQDHEYAPRERKDPTMCHPSKAVHLYVEVESVSIDSSDGVISDPSTGDSGSSSEEEDDSSSDEGGDSDSD